MEDKKNIQQEDEHEENVRRSVCLADHDVSESEDERTPDLDRRPVQCTEKVTQRHIFLPDGTRLHSPFEHDLMFPGLYECTDLPQEAANSHRNLPLLGIYESIDLPQSVENDDNILPLPGLCECTDLPQDTADHHIDLLLLELFKCTDLPQESGSNADCASDFDGAERLYSKHEKKTMAFVEDLHLQQLEELRYEKSWDDPIIESVDSDIVFDRGLSELNLYIRNPVTGQSQHQTVQVYMLHASTSGPGNALPEDPPFPEGCHLEIKRLATFSSFPPSCPIFAVRLAGDGFVYRPNLEAVDCNFCRLRIHLSDLSTSGFHLQQTHLNRSPQCPFKQRRDCGNVPFPNWEQFRGIFQASQSGTRSQELDDVENRQTTAGTGQPGINTTMSHRHGNCITSTDTTTTGISQQPSLSVTRVPTSSGAATPAAVYSSMTIIPSAPPAGNTTQPNTEISVGTPAVTAQATGGTNVAASRSATDLENQTGYEDCMEGVGFVVKKPKRKDMADLQKRLDSFKGKWKHSHIQTSEKLAEAGLYFAGYKDCARCYFCGGGLRVWAPQDEPFIQHARFYPRCGFLHLSKGYLFVEIVQQKNRAREHITLEDVEHEVQRKMAREGDRKRRASYSRSESNLRPGNISTTTPGAAVGLDIEAQKEENKELKSEMMCKICMEDDRLVVLLPCGHVVACQTCAANLRSCPLCRADIKNRVHARFH